ncbi:MAG: ferrous iron transport protein A [Coprobacillus sp.]|nr:ferrous iron transport protein A [Coprobacillus sp.]
MPRLKRKRKIIIDNPETLDQLNVDQTAWIKSVNLPDGQMRRRLQDLGIIEGTRVVCKQAAPSGNPKSFLVRGATIAIRTEDSKNVYITTKEPTSEDETQVVEEENKTE